MPTDWSALSHRPVFFERNRVARVYDGGKLFADFFGDEPVDGKQPEEWIASTVRAINPGSTDPQEGLSLVEGTDIPFRDLLAREPVATLGTKTSFDVLVKALDSAIRLPVQAHPDPAFSRTHFHSDFGKTEMWLVLKTRPGACIYFGFREQLTKAQFAKAVAQSEADRDALEPLLNRMPVREGEVYLIPARCVHALGAGCLVLEVQEPTDFTIQPEFWCGDYHLSAADMYLGLDPDTALDCFDFRVYGESAVHHAQKEPVLIASREGYRLESLVSYADTPCFSVLRHTLAQCEVPLPHAPALYIVLSGEGGLRWAGETRTVHTGSYFFLPHCLAGAVTLQTGGALQVACCLPPR